MTEDEQDALAFPIDTARQVEDGQKDVIFRLKSLFETVIAAEFAYGANDDIEFANALARAKEDYRYTKEYATDTYTQQVGLTEEEIKAIEDARALAESGDDGIAVVEVDEDAAKALQEQIAKQREEEQRIKAELVAKAQAELEAA